jgi:hypothetical protein
MMTTELMQVQLFIIYMLKILIYVIFQIGSVYVYDLVDNTWVHNCKILAKDGIAADNFGRTVSVYESTGMIGAYSDDDKGTNSGTISITISTYTY